MSMNLTVGNPGHWEGDEPPTRERAMLLAARCASAAGDPTVPAEVGATLAAQSRAWSAVAELADLVEMEDGLVAGPALKPIVSFDEADGDSHVCQHVRTVMPLGQNQGIWLHVDQPQLSRCDAPW